MAKALKAYYQVQERETNYVRAEFEFLHDAIGFWMINANGYKIVPVDAIAYNLMEKDAIRYLEMMASFIWSANRKWWSK